jgi:tetratricopeptide (TPR) repeat protein
MENGYKPLGFRMKFLRSIFKRDYQEYIKRGNLYFQEGKWHSALIEYQKALEILEPQEESAKGWIEKKLRDSRNHLAMEYVQKGDSYAGDQQWDLAIEAYQTAKDLYGEFAPEIDEIQEKLEIALEMHQEKTLNERLKHVGLEDSLGFGFAELRRIKNFGLYQITPYDVRFDDSLHFTDRQIADLKARLILNPEDPDLHFDLGMIYARYGFLTKAIEEMKRVIQICPTHSEAYFVLGNLYSDYGDLQESLRFLKKSIELDPKFEPAYYYLGQLYEKLQNPSKAEEMYLKFIKQQAKTALLDENTLQGYLALGHLYKKQGHYLQATTILQEYLNKDPSNEEVYAYLGEIYTLMEDWKKAFQCWEKVVEIEPESELAKEARQHLKELVDKKKG